MKRVILIIMAIILLALGGFLLLNNQSGKTTVEEKTLTLSEQVRSTNGQIIDVREPSEYESGHADGAINIPLGNILNGDFSKIDQNRPIYVYCRSGVRAGQAKVALEKVGNRGVTNLGGLSDWQAKGSSVCPTMNPSC